MSQLRRLAVALFAISACAPVAACSSSDTILALTINPDKDAPAITSVHVSIRHQADGSTDVLDQKFAAGAAINDGSTTPTFYERIQLNGTTGRIYIHAEGLLPNGSIMGQGDTQADLAEGEATAASITFSDKGTPTPTGDAGADATPDAAHESGGDVNASPGDAATDTAITPDVMSSDATQDSVTVDATPNAIPDATPDVHADAVSDVHADTALEAAADAHADADAHGDASDASDQ